MARIVIDVAAQRLRVEGCAAPFSCPVSTGKAGLGSEAGSGRTPTGRFAVYSRHGENAPPMTVFRGRLPVGLWPQAAEGEDAILARILVLEGMEPHNANTRARYIYIHGTADVERLGKPASHGCIRLAPEDMVRLFALAPIGTEVMIRPPQPPEGGSSGHSTPCSSRAGAR